MHIYIHPFVLGIIATLVVEVGICFLVGYLSSRKNKEQGNMTNNDAEGNQTD